MNMGDIEFRHIVDVDGQLIGIEAEVVDARTLLARLGRGFDRSVSLVRAGERIPIETNQRIRLSEDEVLFFETTKLKAVPSSSRSPFRHLLAA